ncbi:hypothetical protein [Kitasatospora sp. LaBMicrA B282]|uniref:hypothetical protein n=1 Tax=Kitasatospora sp. LaBMicrA B282 TaxID=3420949 RepID=UPI003D0C0A3D
MPTDPAASDWRRNEGIVNIQSSNTGNQAVGDDNTLTVQQVPAPPLPEQVTVADLRTALQAVREDLARLRAEDADAVPDEDADEALTSLDRVGEEAEREQPRPRAIRRHLTFVVDALESATALTTASGGLAVAATALVTSLGALQAIVLKLFGG